MRHLITAAYGSECIYCGLRCHATDDHVEPLSRGGKNGGANIVPACQQCNGEKGPLSLFRYIAGMSTLQLTEMRSRSQKAIARLAVLRGGHAIIDGHRRVLATIDVAIARAW